jgi:chromosomal replication initiator protein
METNRTRTPQEIWDTALGELQVQVSKPNYRTWFVKTTGLSYEDNQFVVGVPNTFAAEYLDKNQRSLIEKVLFGLTSPEVQVEFHVNGKHKNHQSNVDTIPGISAPVPAYTRLNPNYIFDYFIEGVCNRLALASALAVARNPGHSYNPLYIYGGAGLGKTHLLHAIGHAAAANHINVICTSAEQFTNDFLSALRDKSTEEFRHKYRKIGMLLIDDIHFIGGKEQTEESFFHTFNELHNTNRQIVITSDCPPREIPLIEERLRSRFEWGLIVDIQPPDFDTRLAILQTKAKQLGVDLASDVIEYVAHHIQDNIRVLEGSLNRVVAFAKLLKAVPNRDIAARALEDIANKEPVADAVTSATILEAVAENFHLDKEELVGRRRDKDAALARRLAMYLIRQETNYSLAQIGRELGNRDAASVTAACKKIASDINYSPYLKRKVKDIKYRLHSKSRSKSANRVKK